MVGHAKGTEVTSGGVDAIDAGPWSGGARPRGSMYYTESAQETSPSLLRLAPTIR